MDAQSEMLRRACAEALFASAICTGSKPNPVEAREAIRSALWSYGGRRGCISIMAFEYGDHPEAAALRMSWAIALVQETFESYISSAPINLYASAQSTTHASSLWSDVDRA